MDTFSTMFSIFIFEAGENDKYIISSKDDSKSPKIRKFFFLPRTVKKFECYLVTRSFFKSIKYECVMFPCSAEEIEELAECDPDVSFQIFFLIYEDKKGLKCFKIM
jgi:hypothetical protein